MIDRYLLRYFLAVVDRGNFSAAARHCRVSQPTLSIGIAKLEDSLGQSLFHRTNRRVELTAAGARLVSYARRIEADFAEAERAVKEDAPTSTIRIGILSTLPTAWIEAAVAAAMQGSSSERVEIVEARPREISALLDRARIDAGIGLVSSEDEALWSEEYGVALRRDHPLAQAGTISADQLAGETMFVRRDCEALAEVSRYFTGRGIRPFMATRTTSEDRALAYVRSGLGITVSPGCFACPDIAIVPLSGFSQTRSIGLLVDPLQPDLVARSPALAQARQALSRMASR